MLQRTWQLVWFVLGLVAAARDEAVFVVRPVAPGALDDPQHAICLGALERVRAPAAATPREAELGLVLGRELHPPVELGGVHHERSWRRRPPARSCAPLPPRLAGAGVAGDLGGQ